MTLLRWSSLARAFPAQSSFAWPTMPTLAARPTWVFILTCCPAIIRSRHRKVPPGMGRRFRRPPGLTLPEMVESAKAGKLKAFYVVGANPVGRFGIDPFAFSQEFVVVQDMFLTETACIADVVLPAANAYEKVRDIHQYLRRSATGEEGGRGQRQQVRFRNDRAHRGCDGCGRSQTGAVRTAAPARTWDNRAERSQARQTGMRFGWKRTAWNRR